MSELSEATRAWLHFKEVFGGKRTSARGRRGNTGSDPGAAPTAAEQLPFGPARDPRPLGQVLTGLFAEFAWERDLANARVLAAWPQLVGPTVAAHTHALFVDNGTLVVQCDATAWATQLRLMRADLLERILAEHPESELLDIDARNPGAPSWKHGPRSVPGRGPRDTYG